MISQIGLWTSNCSTTATTIHSWVQYPGSKMQWNKTQLLFHFNYWPGMQKHISCEFVRILISLTTLLFLLHILSIKTKKQLFIVNVKVTQSTVIEDKSIYQMHTIKYSLEARTSLCIYHTKTRIRGSTSYETELNKHFKPSTNLANSD